MKTIKAVTIAAAATGALAVTAPAASASTQGPAPSLSVKSVSANGVVLAWTQVPQAINYEIDGVQCSPVSTGAPASGDTINSISVDPVCGLFPGVTYNIEVHAQFNGLGNFSPDSNMVSVRLP